MIRQKKVWVLRLHELRSAGLKCLKLQRLWNDKREARSLLDPTHFSLMMVVYCCLTANSKTSGQLFNPSASRWLSDGTLLIVFKLWNKWFFGGKRPICVHLDAGGSSLSDLGVIFTEKHTKRETVRPLQKRLSADVLRVCLELVCDMHFSMGPVCSMGLLHVSPSGDTFLYSC